MKLRYFGYYLRKFDNQKKFLFNIKSIVDAFIDSNNMELKSSFKRGGDKLYITQVAEQKHLYYFVRTSDDDLIKRINEKSLTVSDIAEQLSANEKMAYVSYVYLNPIDNIMACASSTSCPRFDDFSDYINELFIKVGLANYELNIAALTSSSNKKDLMKMEMVNSVYVDVAADKSLGKLIAKELTGNSNASLGNFRITVEPTGINLKKPFIEMLNRLAPSGEVKNTQGVIQIGAKAKHNELKGQLIDYWLDNENNLVDSLNPKAKTKLPDQITAKYDDNSNLDSLYNKYVRNNSLKSETDILLSKYEETSQFAKKMQTPIDSISSANDEVVVAINTEVSH
jgi:Fe-S cluster assembly iron-binding protein IscA